MGSATATTRWSVTSFLNDATALSGLFAQLKDE